MYRNISSSNIGTAPHHIVRVGHEHRVAVHAREEDVHDVAPEVDDGQRAAAALAVQLHGQVRQVRLKLGESLEVILET